MSNQKWVDDSLTDDKPYSKVPLREYYKNYFPWKSGGVGWPGDLRFAPPLRERHYNETPIFCLRCLLEEHVVQKSERVVYPLKYMCPVHGWHSHVTSFYGYTDLLQVYSLYIVKYKEDLKFIVKYLEKKLRSLKDY